MACFLQVVTSVQMGTPELPQLENRLEPEALLLDWSIGNCASQILLNPHGSSEKPSLPFLMFVACLSAFNLSS